MATLPNANQFTNTNTNMTSSSGLSAGMQTYYNKLLLEDREADLVHEQFCTHIPFPRNSGTTMNLRKLLKLASNTTPLLEGNPGDGQMLSEVAVTMQIKQYGDYVRTTDWLDLVHLDERIERRVLRMRNAAWRSIDEMVRDEMATVPNVIYAGGKTARNALTASDKLTNVEIRKAVVFLKNHLAQPFGDGMFVGIINPNITYDLQDDDRFVAVSEYQDKQNIYKGEIGRLNGFYGIRLVEATNMKIFTGAGASSADVASVIVLGREAIYDTDLMGGNPRIIVKNPGSAGTQDPLDQIATVGWKLNGWGVKALQPQYAVRIECGFTE